MLKIEDTQKVKPLFGDWQETLIWSCIQKVMGNVYADREELPRSAVAMLGDFCFLAGKPDRETAAYKPADCSRDFRIVVPQTEEWGALIADIYGDRARKVIRYAFRKDNRFDTALLQKAAGSLPEDYTMKLMDEELFVHCRAHDWSRDFVSLYGNYEQYRNLGIGVVVLKGGEPVAGASSYARYLDGIEIEIDTRQDQRRKGLAYACGAKLILECLERGLYPSWDAQNKWSAALAQKLGYIFDHEYTAYEIYGYLT